MSTESAVERASKVNPLAKASATDDAVLVSFRGRSVKEGVAIWRTGDDEYHLHVWYDYVG
jgi:hypothetical protein